MYKKKILILGCLLIPSKNFTMLYRTAQRLTPYLKNVAIKQPTPHYTLKPYTPLISTSPVSRYSFSSLPQAQPQIKPKYHMHDVYRYATQSPHENDPKIEKLTKQERDIKNEKLLNDLQTLSNSILTEDEYMSPLKTIDTMKKKIFKIKLMKKLFLNLFNLYIYSLAKPHNFLKH